MSLRSRFFAMTYDRQMAKVEKVGQRGHGGRATALTPKARTPTALSPLLDKVAP